MRIVRVPVALKVSKGVIMPRFPAAALAAIGDGRRGQRPHAAVRGRAGHLAGAAARPAGGAHLPVRPAPAGRRTQPRRRGEPAAAEPAGRRRRRRDRGEQRRLRAPLAVPGAQHARRCTPSRRSSTCPQPTAAAHATRCARRGARRGRPSASPPASRRRRASSTCSKRCPRCSPRVPDARVVFSGAYKDTVGEDAYWQRLAPLLERHRERLHLPRPAADGGDAELLRRLRRARRHQPQLDGGVRHGTGRGHAVGYPGRRHRSARRARGGRPHRHGADRAAARSGAAGGGAGRGAARAGALRPPARRRASRRSTWSARCGNTRMLFEAVRRR